MVVTGTFYGESRIFTFPMQDLNGLVSGSLQNQAGGNPLQLSSEKNGDWLIWGASAQVCTAAAGGLATNSPINTQIQRLDNQESWAPEVQLQGGQAGDLGTPLEHLCGKAGNANYFSYPKRVASGVRLKQSVSQFTGATPTGRSPLYTSLHAQLVKGEQAPMLIGSKYDQQLTYRGRWVPFTGMFDFATTNLGVNQSAQLTIPINANQYFFIDTLLARYQNDGNGPNSDLNPLTAENETLVTVKDTSSEGPFTLPNPAPLWCMFGSRAAQAYHPATCFVVRPGGSLDITIKNGPTAALDKKLWLTFGGCLIDDMSKKILEKLNS